MSTPAPSADARSDAGDSQMPDASWYTAFTAAADPAPPRTSDTVSTAPAGVSPDILETLQPSDIPGPHHRNAEMPWQTLLRVQQAELNRLAQANEKLMHRVDMLLGLQEREQALREQLQNQIGQVRGSSPSTELEAIRREARAGVTEELKPVLLAILDALERFADKPAKELPPAEIIGPADPLRFEDYGKLPAILTRPLDELVDEGSEPGRSMSESPRQRPRKSVFRNRKQSRKTVPDPDRTIGPGPFTSTTVLSS